jgi:hypothetical protein
MYKDKIKTFEKLTRILELINVLQNYNLHNSNKVNVWHEDRIKINKLIIIRLKKYYNNNLNKLGTFKIQ